MPPKGSGVRPPLITPNPPSQRNQFSIGNFFDAATARRNGGGPYRLGTPLPLSQSYSSSQPAVTHGASSSGTGHPVPQQPDPQHHWSSVSHSAALSRSGGGVDASASSSASSLVSSGVSSTLLEVRSRIVRELEGSQQGSREAASKLHVHRQRALRVAFGEEAGGKAAPQRAAHTSTRSGSHLPGAAPAGSSSSGGGKEGGGEEDEEEELLVSSVEFSLLCPYSRLPIRYPVRSRDCNHLQCCDLESWIVMLDKCRSMRDPVGPCPVCERRVIASSLEVDLWMKNVIDQMPSGTHMVVLEPDGSFRNGDTTREKRKEQLMMEVVDATQGDYENYLGEVVDDDDDDVVVQAGPSSAVRGAPATLAGALATAGTRRPRSPSPSAEANATAALSRKHVKQEKAEAMMAADASTPPSASQDDGGVVVVHFVEGHHDGLQALPSQIRLWVPHCTNCGAPRVKAEDGSVEGCPRCGQNEKEKWNLVRRFEEAPTVSMELMTDGTLVLHGVDLIAPYLYRAGFHRSLFEVMEYAPLTERQQQHYQPPPGVWATSFPLSRFEIDFLEACCSRVAEGKGLDDIENLIVPSLFRIPRRRRPGAPSASSQYQPSQRFQSTASHTVTAGGSSSQSRTSFAQGGPRLAT